MRKITFLIAFMLSMITAGYGQTVLINPAGDGGFANGNTFAANGWSVSNSANNPWYVGPVGASGAMTGNVAYVSSAPGGAAHEYSTTATCSNYFWRDITVPAGQSIISLTFNWIGQGESNWDMMQVFVAPTTITPVGTTSYPGDGSSVSIVPPGIAGATFIGAQHLQGTVQTANYLLPTSLAGTTFRLIFHWKSDTTTGTQPPAAVDNISLTSRVPVSYVSAASGNYNAAATWVGGVVPPSTEHIVVSAGHTVTINASNLSIGSATVNGIVDFGSTPSSFAINGNLTVNSGGLVKVFNGTTGKTLSVAGNIINNGSIDVSVGTTSAGNLTFNGSAVQTLSGTGSFVNNKIRNLTFNNTSTAIPNINWQMNNISVEYNLNITNAKINLGTNTFTYGTSATTAGDTFTVTNGGFMAGGKFSRWWTASGTGYTTSGPTSVATSAAGRYPFYTTDGQLRVFYLGRTTPSAGGVYAVTFNNSPSFTTGLSIADGAYTVTDRYNSNFVVTTEGTTPAAASNWVTIFAPNAYIVNNGNSRVIGQSAALSGTHINSSNVPSAQRSGVSTADLTTATGLYMGIAQADFSFIAVANGNWNSAATWSKGTIPTCTDSVVIPSGFNVTVNSAANVIQNVTIAPGGTLTVASGDLTVGCTLNNNVFTNNGILTVTGGTLNINGNLASNGGSTFNQSGGDINVDGNSGAQATSVPASTSIVYLGTHLINWTGGTLTIVDPHAHVDGYNSLSYSSPTAAVNVTSGHTLRFGNGTSTDAGGSSSYGFRINSYASSYRISFNNIIVNTGSASGVGSNRFVSTTYDLGVNGNMVINPNGVFRDNGSALYITGNIQNNGAYVATGTLYFGTFLNGTSGVSTLAQTVSGTGTFSNATSSPTANFTSVTVNNNNAAGVTFTGTSNIATQPANSVSASGTLTFTLGKIKTAGNASFILGASGSTLGTLSYTSGGFGSGVTFGRWFGATTTGSAIAAGTDASSSTSRYPFSNVLNQDRSAFIERTAPASASGVLGVTYNEVAGTTAISVTDASAPAFTADTKANDTWAVSVISGTPTAATSFELQLLAPGIFGGATVTASSRIIQGSSFTGTHQAGTVTPGAQRIFTPAELVAGPFSIATTAAEVPFVSIANGDWNNTATWNKNAVPSCTDLVNIAPGTTVTVNAAGAVSKNTTIAGGGTLTITSGDLTVGCTLNNNGFTNNGTLTVTGGTLNVNGNMLHNSGSTYNQSGGDINVDGNAGGVVANSVAASTALVQINTNLINWTGGTLTIVDPHAASSTSTYSLQYNGNNVNVTAGHTLRFGNGTSTDAGGSTSYGFRYYVWQGSGRMTFNNVVINGGSGTNRFVSIAGSNGINGDLTINAGSEFRDAGNTQYVGKDLVNNGMYISTATLYLGTFLNGTAGATTNAQTISGTGTFANNATAASVTANVSSLTINNSNATGVTLGIPMSLSGTLTLTAGKLNTTTANMLTVGTTTAAGTISGGSATSYVSGPIARTIATANANTNYIFFPVGKAAYAPIWLAPATTAVTVMKAEAFDTNAGTMNPSIINLSANRRWEAPLVSGAFTDINVRIADFNLTGASIPVIAPAADGVYTGTFGSTGTYSGGYPATIQSTTALPSASYSGFLSYAVSNLCSGTPAPGNTVTTANNLCSGTQITLSAQNLIPGSGVTYQWQSSPDGVAYTDITGATNATYVITPTVSTYYKLKVTCSAGPATGESTPVHITFANTVTAVTNNSRCGTGTVALSATPSTGATIKWYAAATGGASLGTGTTFTTPSISTTTTYYAVAQTGDVINGGKLAPESDWTGSTFTDWGIVFNAIQNTNLSSVDIYSTSSGTVDLKITNASGTELFSTGNITVTAGGVTTPTTIPLNFALTAGTQYKLLVKSSSGVSLVRGSSNLAFPYTNENISVTASEWGGTTTGTYYYMFNLRTGTTGLPVCQSLRVPVTATVTPAPALTLSGNPPAICAGQTTSAVTITAGASDYDVYTWTPSTGVTGNATTGWTFNPAVTTTYTLNASQSTGTMCVANAATVTVNVNSLPSAVTLADAAVCETGSAVALAPTGGTTSITVLSEGFNGATNNWTTINNSTGGTVANSAWTLRPDGYNTTAIGAPATTWHSNDNSQYYMTNSDSQGSSTTLTSTILMSPSFSTVGLSSATISFYHYFYEPAATNFATAKVEVSLNGTDWTSLQTYTTTTGAGGNFAAANVVLTGPYLNQPSVYVRFKFDGVWRYYWGIDNVSVVGQKLGDIIWSPVTGLYTDAAATTAYTGTPAATVYAKPLANTTYTLTVTNSSGCSITDTVDVTITTTPAPTVTAVMQDICNAGTVADLVATGTGIKWYAAETGGTALASTTPLVNNTTYYASQTVAGCESTVRTARTANITVIAAPTTPAASQDICNAGTVADLVATGTGIKWYAAETGGTALADTTVLVDAATYYASQTIVGCESIGRTPLVVNIDVVPAPDVAAPTQLICNAGTVADLDATGTGILWYAAETGGTALADDAALVDGTTYYASQTIDGCEGITRRALAVDINVVAAPEVASPTQTVCNTGTVADLNATGTGILWYAAENGGTPLADDAALVDGTTYYASQTIDGCEGVTRRALTVNFNVVAAPSVQANTQVICNSGTVADLQTNGNGILWYLAETGGIALATDTQLADGTVYYASQTVDGCESVLRTPLLVDFNVVAAPGVDPSGIQDFCNIGAVADLEANGTNVQWYTAAEGGTLLTANDLLTDDTIYYASQTIDGCESALRTPLTVNINVVADIDGEATQTITVDTVADATIEDIVIDTEEGAIVTWYPTFEDAVLGTDAIAAGTQLTAGEDYFATQTVGNCTSAPFGVTVDVVLGKEDFNRNAFTYYPNPVKDVLNLSYTQDITSVSVFNLLGQQVISVQPNVSEAKIDMSVLADGTYIVNVAAGNAVNTIKVVKKR